MLLPTRPPLIATANLDIEKIKGSIRDWCNKKPQATSIAYVVDMEHMDRSPLPEPIYTLVVNGYNRLRSGDMEIIMNPGWYDYGGKQTGTTHGTWNPYDTHIPLIWYGWHVPKGETDATVHMTDIAPTVAALLHIQMPNGCIGKVIPFEQNENNNKSRD